MADEDDDEGFGDFKFAPTFPNPSATVVDPNPNFDGRGSSFSDDDWGDFVTPRADQINGFPNSQPPLDKKPSDHLGNSPVHSESPVSDRADSDKARWVKPQGALPLSLFGELEEEQEVKSGACESAVGDGEAVFFHKKDDSGKMASNLNVGGGINDLIANLYNQSPQIKSPNGSNQELNMNGGANPNSNGSSINFDVLVSNSNGFGSSSDNMNTISNQFDSNINGINLNPNGLNSYSTVLDSNFHSISSNTNGLDQKVDGMNGNSNNLDSDFVELKEDLDADDDDDGWEFQGAEADKQVDESRNEIVREAGQTFGFGSTGHGPINASISPGSSQGTGEWNFGFDFKSGSLAQDDLFSDSYSKSKKNDTDTGSNVSEIVKNVNSDVNFWHFKDAFSEAQVDQSTEVTQVASPAAQDYLFSDSYPKSKSNDINTRSNVSEAVKNVDTGVNFCYSKDAISEAQVKPSMEAAKAVSPAAPVGHAVDGVGAHGPNEFLATSEGVFNESRDWNFEFTFNTSVATEDGTISGSNSSGVKHDNAGITPSPGDEHDESDDDVWEFKDAFSETETKHEGTLVIAHGPPASVTPAAFDNAFQWNNVNLENNQKALPLSIFGDEELEMDDSSIHQDIFPHKPAVQQTSSIKSVSSGLSINDLISSLYSQVEQNASENHAPKVNENATYSATRAVENDLLNHDDDFDDASWEFKDASANAKIQDQTFINHVQDSPCTKLLLNDCVEFYQKLKDELHFVTLGHLETLKKAQNSSILSGEDSKAKALGEEFQKIYDQLCQDNMISKELQMENLSSRTTCLSELFEVMQEPKFRVLESEFQLSKQFSLAEKDLRSAIELSNHASSALRILKLASLEEQSNYVSTWTKIVSVCAQELKHGAFIWEQSLQNNVHSQMLSAPQGRQYLRALGEIYRVVEVLGASSKLYKLWVLLASADPTGLFSLLNECAMLWSSSGLDVALLNISEPNDFEHYRPVKTLLESINYIHNLDTQALHNHVFSEKQPTCRLSMLAGIIPGIKMVVWNEENYLLTLANLWANRISSNPPNLPHLDVS